jgi:hypothetical protein
MSNPLSTQVGGSHYKSFTIQPVEFAMRNGYDACIFSAVKYISRHHLKNGIEDLNKARHFLDMRFEIMGHVGNFGPRPRTRIDPGAYASANGLGILESAAIVLIHLWSASTPQNRREDLLMLAKAVIDEIIRKTSEECQKPRYEIGED